MHTKLRFMQLRLHSLNCSVDPGSAMWIALERTLGRSDRRYPCLVPVPRLEPKVGPVSKFPVGRQTSVGATTINFRSDHAGSKSHSAPHDALV